MKKTIALILAIVMMAAMAVPAFAAASVETQTVSAAGSQEATVTYGVTETYKVTLPSAINFNDAKTVDATVTVADNMVIKNNTSVKVTMISKENQGIATGEWKMVSEEGAVLKYTVTKPTAVNVPNNFGGTAEEILSVPSNAAGTGGSVTLTFATEGTSQAGTFTDTITFGVSVG